MNSEETGNTGVKQPGSGMAVASMVMGISSVICCGFFLGIPAIIFSSISLHKIGKGIHSNAGKGYAIAGLVTGIVGTLNIAMIAILAGMMLPALSQTREKARRISCASDLKQIGLAIRMYSMDNKEQFPDKNGARGLEMLRSGKYLENVKIYTCPSSHSKVNDGKPLTEENVDYVYVGGYNESSSPDTPIAYDKPKNHIKYGNILFADGHVQGYAGANWMDNIKK
jgi:prepilin-type processing-associated H-X9-DG protein